MSDFFYNATDRVSSLKHNKVNKHISKQQVIFKGVDLRCCSFMDRLP